MAKVVFFILMYLVLFGNGEIRVLLSFYRNMFLVVVQIAMKCTYDISILQCHMLYIVEDLEDLLSYIGIWLLLCAEKATFGVWVYWNHGLFDWMVRLTNILLDKQTNTFDISMNSMIFWALKAGESMEFCQHEVPLWNSITELELSNSQFLLQHGNAEDESSCSCGDQKYH
jgi:hypothetical protein